MISDAGPSWPASDLLLISEYGVGPPSAASPVTLASRPLTAFVVMAKPGGGPR